MLGSGLGIPISNHLQDNFGKPKEKTEDGPGEARKHSHEGPELRTVRSVSDPSIITYPVSDVI